jgi:hypothetical protein
MVNTKCCECMFASPVEDSNTLKGCSKDIISKIMNIKEISIDENGYNHIQNYACRYGFSQNIYNQYKENFIDGSLEQMINTNTLIRLYLIIDCSDPSIDFDNIIAKLSNLDIPPVAISFMFRSRSFRPFLPEKHNDLCNSLLKNCKWKAHNFLYDIVIDDAISHVLSTNARMNSSYYFLVYDGSRIDQLNTDIININDNVILYQKPMIAMIESQDTLHKFFMSFDNYAVSKEISHSLLESIKKEQNNIIYY